MAPDYSNWDFKDTLDKLPDKEVYKMVMAVFSEPDKRQTQMDMVDYLKRTHRYDSIIIGGLSFLNIITYIDVNKVTLDGHFLKTLKQIIKEQRELEKVNGTSGTPNSLLSMALILVNKRKIGFSTSVKLHNLLTNPT